MAAHWILVAILSCITSLFRKLTYYIPLPRIPSRSTSSTSQGGTSPTAARSPQAITFDWSFPGPEHPIAVQFHSLELGKVALGLSIPLTAALLVNHYQGLTRLQDSVLAIVLSVGFAATWNGMLLHGIYPRATGALEYFGVVTILVAFFGIVSSFLPPSLKWGCWLCCGLSCLPFLLCLVPLKAVAKEPSSAEQLGEDMV